MKKRILSIIIVLALCLSLLPTMALAGADNKALVTVPEKPTITPGDNTCTVTLVGTYDASDGHSNEPCTLTFVLSGKEVASGRTYTKGGDYEVTDSSADTGIYLNHWDGEPPSSVADAEITIFKQAGELQYVGASMRVKYAETCELTFVAEWSVPHTHNNNNNSITFEPWPNTTSLPTTAGNYYLLGDVTLTDTWSPKVGSEGNPAITNLCLNGHVIKYQSETNGSVIKVPANATLNLYDCGTTVHKFTDSDTTTGLWVWDDTLEGDDIKHTVFGGCITGGTGTDRADDDHFYGGGVYVAAGGEFVFNGGNIVGNSAVDSSDEYSTGGGVYVEYDTEADDDNKMGTFTIPANCSNAVICGNLAVYGGGVINYGNFTMDSGRIEYNMATTSGGGIYASKPFTMTDGMICNNTAGDGGGVSVQGTAFTMNGGSISDNTAYSWGAGVYSEGGSFTMTGGNISDNTAAYFDDEGMHGKGGGVYSSGGAVTVTGGSVTRNTAALNYGGVYVESDTTVKLGGTVQITDNHKAANYGEETETLTENNLYLPTGKTITLGTSTNGTDGNKVLKPASGMLVGVTTATEPTVGTPVVIVTSGATSGDDDRFFSDAGYSMSRSDGKLQIDDGYAVKVGGTPITMTNKGDVLGDGTGSYAPATKTLTLNNANITTLGEKEYIAILSNLHDDLTINLVGNNQIGGMKVAQPTSKDDYTVGIGISSVNSGVTLTGNGSLTMYTGTTGIRATDVNISSEFTGTLTIKNYGVFISAGSFISDMPAIRADNNVGVRGGTLDVTSRDSGGIYAGEGNIVIEGEATKVNVTSDKFSGIKAAPVTMGTGGGSVRIYDGAKVTVSAGTKVDKLITNVYGIFAAGGIEIGMEDEGKAPEVTVTAGNANVSNVEGKDYEVCGIMSKNRDTTIYDAKVSVTANGTEAADRTGIQTYKELSINGGTTTVTSDGQGITVAQNVSITDGEVSITSKGSGIAGEAGVTISGGTVDATSNEGNGILAYGSVVITGDKTKVTADGATMGIVGKSVAIEGGTVKAKGETAIQVGSGLVINTDKLEILNVNVPYEAETSKTLIAKDGGYVTIQPKQATPPSSGGDYTPTVTIPVAGDKDSVKISATVSGSTAKIKNVTSEQLETVGTGKEVTVDLSSLNKSVTGVTFPKTTLENIAESEAIGLEVKLPGGTTAVFDKATVAAIAEQAAGSDIQLVVDTTVKAAQVLTGAQKSAIKGMKSALVLEAYFTSNGKRISDFKGGEAELTVSYPTTKPVRVWYLTEEGALEEVPSSFDGKSASFVVKHFSNYVIEQLDETAMPFVDVAENSYYYDAVKWAAENGITKGTDAVHFSPKAPVTRAQAVTLLWRAAGKPVVNYAMSFVDVPSGAYYAEAVRWAVSEGITKGTTDTAFSPNATCTRGQIVTFLARFAGVADEATGYTHGFTDVNAADYYNNAVAWAKDNGVTGGTSATTFAPKANCTRAQVVTFLYRYLGK